MAALSVHRWGGGTETGIGEVSRKRCVRDLLDATPPLSKICFTCNSSAVLIVFVTRTSTTASWKLAATLATNELFSRT